MNDSLLLDLMVTDSMNMGMTGTQHHIVRKNLKEFDTLADEHRKELHLMLDRLIDRVNEKLKLQMEQGKR